MPHLDLFLLGSPRIELDGGPIDISRRKAVALLAYLAVTRQPHSRETLAALFWPEVEASRAYAYLRTTLWTLNKTLGADWIEAGHETVALHPGGNLRLDVQRFRALLDGAPAGDLEQRAARFSEAAALYQDDFMAGFTLPDSPAFDEWQFFEREDLRRRFGTLLDDLVNDLVLLGRFDAAIPAAQRRLALDTLHEPAHRQLVRLYAWAGQWTAALRQVQQCLSILRQELGIGPDAETQALFDAVQERRVLDAPVSAPAAHAPAGTNPAPAWSHLPAQSTPLVARERELREIAALIADPACRLLTLVGQGGIGKTRLALQAAADIEGHYADGAYFVPLAPVNTAEYLIPALADALQFSTFRESDPKLQLLCYLNEKHTLLVMDNFEHLIDGAGLLTEILTSAPQVKILVTSRERLQLQEEWVYEIHGLAYPDDAGSPPLSDPIHEYGAVQLFLQSGRRAQPDFTLTEENTAAVRRICQLVEGMPLGLLLAGAWLPMLAPREIVQEIEHSLDFLSTSLRSLPERHRSIRAVFESSWERLTPDEQTALCKLSVFRGGFWREAAQTVAEAALPTLLALVNKSLLHREAEGCYSIHELLRQFAQEKLEAVPEVRDQAHDRYTRYYAAFMREREPALKGKAQVQALNEIEADIDNIRLAWMLAIGRRSPAISGDLLQGLALFYMMRSRLQESSEMFVGTARYLETLDDLSGEEQILLAYVKTNLALALQGLDQTAEPAALYQEVLPVLSPLESKEAGFALIMLGGLNIWPIEDFQAAESLAYKALAIFEAQQDQWGIAHALRLLGDAAHHAIHYERSRPIYEQSLAISRTLGDLWGEEGSLNMLGEVAYTLGDYPETERLYRESLALAEIIGDRYNVLWCMDRIANALARQGQYQAARFLALQQIDLARELGKRGHLGYGLMGLAEIETAERNYERALRYCDQSLEAFKETGSLEGPGWMYIAHCQIALDMGQAGEIERLARPALAIFDKSRSPWGRSAALYFLGEAARLRGEIPAAGDNLRQAVRLATQSKSIMLLVRYLAGFGALFAQIGQPERAVELLGLVVQHPATWQMVRERALEQLAGLRSELPPDLLAAAQSRGAARPVEEVIAELLHED